VGPGLAVGEHGEEGGGEEQAREDERVGEERGHVAEAGAGMLVEVDDWGDCERGQGTGEGAATLARRERERG
jgi:hypothetical protein